MGKHCRASVHEHRISGNVIKVVVGVDHKCHRNIGEFANRGKELFAVLGGEITIGIDGCRCVYDDDSIITDDESRVRPAIGNRDPNIRADLLQRKQRLGNALCAGLTAEVKKNNTGKQQERQGSVCSLLEGCMCRQGEEQEGFHGAAPFANGLLPAEDNLSNSKWDLLPINAALTTDCSQHIARQLATYRGQRRGQHLCVRLRVPDNGYN